MSDAGGRRGRLSGWAPGGAVSLRTLVITRWIGVAGQAIAVLVVYFGFGFDMPIYALLGVISASAALNVALQMVKPAASRIADRDVAMLLAYDIVQLAGLLFLSGGLENPFVVLMVAPVAISATTLPRLHTALVCLLSLAAISIIGYAHDPLPLGAGIPLNLPLIYRVGLWAALCIGVLFVAVYANQVAEDSRRRRDALAATQIALAREQRRSAVAALTAAAAHELGSPLATITVVATELAAELPDEGELREDIDLLLEQTQRCRDILSRLTRRREPLPSVGEDPLARVSLETLVGLAAEPWRGGPAEIVVESRGDGAPPPHTANRPELQHAVGTLIENAAQFARTRVEAIIDWRDNAVTLVIRDDGPGFAPAILSRLGEPYLSTRKSQSAEVGRDGGGERGRGHMGLGVFIAETLLASTGAVIDYANRARGGGAQVAIRWRRDVLEAAADANAGAPPPDSAPDLARDRRPTWRRRPLRLNRSR